MEHLEFFNYIKKTKKTIELFFDIETFKYNEKKAKRDGATFYKGGVYSVAVAWLDPDRDNQPIIERWARFEDLFDFLEGVGVRRHYLMIAHNSEGFDNHYLLKDLTLHYGLKRGQRWLNNAPITNKKGIKKSSLSAKSKFFTLESRVKSRAKLSFYCRLDKVSFETKDTYPITQASLGTLGEMLHRFGYIEKKQMKQDLDYDLYDVDYDMNPDQEMDYARECWQSLNQSQLDYINNDVYILAMVRKHYSDIFPGFKWDVLTLSQNILSAYLHDSTFTYTYKGKEKQVPIYNQLARFQLLLKQQFLTGIDNIEETIKNAPPIVKKNFGKDAVSIDLSKYDWDENISIYGHMKKFYKGGLNFYNDRYVDRSVDEQVKGYDLNSSYPFAMYAFDVPTFMYHMNTNRGIITITNKDKDFHFIEISEKTFNDLIGQLDSRVLRQMFTKYYTTHYENVYINTNTLKTLMKFLDESSLTIPYLSITGWKTVPFGGKEKLAEFYYQKTQGKSDHKIDFKSPLDIEVTDKINTNVLTPPEIYIAKVKMNGLYGIPALRPYFNYFYLDPEGVPVNQPNGFKNSSRNIVFASWVTSQAFYNLLSLLFDTPGEVIDENFLYCDTDSLYFKAPLAKYIDKNRIHPRNLGAWDCEHENIEHFYILNHKKYAFYDPDMKQPLQVRAGGVKDGTFDLSLPWEEFIEKEFHNGVIIPVVRSILSRNFSMIVYESEMELEKGGKYPEKIDLLNKMVLERNRQAIRKYLDENQDELNDSIYFETSVGDISLQDVFEPDFSTDDTITHQQYLLSLYQRVAEVYHYDY